LPGYLEPAPAPLINSAEATTPLNVRDALAVPAPELPALEEVKRELPKEQVVLEMPGGAAQRSTVSRDSETISVDFPDEEVRTILRNVATCTSSTSSFPTPSLAAPRSACAT
jgi:hypothetical protein